MESCGPELCSVLGGVEDAAEGKGVGVCNVSTVIVRGDTCTAPLVTPLQTEVERLRAAHAEALRGREAAEGSLDAAKVLTTLL
jgi:hypothetical protein